ncbi:TSC-22/dip/bun family protein [Aphelenchoides avenae]|nr:TSC-22/dip/bun family protein [Aphelenchus avenae]
MNTSGTASPTAKPKGRFMIVPLPGKFTRGRWECCDYYTSPSKDHIEFAGKNGMKEVESETTITSPAPVDNNGSIVCIGDGHTETTQCSGEVADEADSVHELHDDENIATAIPETELEDAAYSETPPESPDLTQEPASIFDDDEGTVTSAKDEAVYEDQADVMPAKHDLNVSEQNLAPSDSLTPASSTMELHVDDLPESAANNVPLGQVLTNNLAAVVNDAQAPLSEILADTPNDTLDEDGTLQLVQHESSETSITAATLVPTGNLGRLPSAEVSTEPLLQSTVTQVESNGTMESTDSTIDAEPSQGETMPPEMPTEQPVPEAKVTSAATKNNCETEATAASSSSDTCASPTTHDQHVAVAKIVQAMDLVKTHLTFAVREEVDTLHTNIAELKAKIAALEAENQVLRQYAPPSVLADLPQPPSPIPPPTPLSTKLSQTHIAWSPTTPKASLLLPQRLAKAALKAQAGLLSGNLHVPGKPAPVPAAQSASFTFISSSTDAASQDADKRVEAVHSTPLRKMSSPAGVCASVSTPVIAQDALSAENLIEAHNHTLDTESFLSPRHDADVFSCGESTVGSLTKANTLEITSVVATPASPSFESKVTQRARHADEFMRNASFPGSLQAASIKEGVARRLFLSTSSDAPTTVTTASQSALTNHAAQAASPAPPLKMLSLELAPTQTSVESMTPNVTNSVATLFAPKSVVAIETNVSAASARSLTDVATTAALTNDMRLVLTPDIPMAPARVESISISQSTKKTFESKSFSTVRTTSTAMVQEEAGHAPSDAASQAPLTPTVVLTSQAYACDLTDATNAAASINDMRFMATPTPESTNITPMTPNVQSRSPLSSVQPTTTDEAEGASHASAPHAPLTPTVECIPKSCAGDHTYAATAAPPVKANHFMDTFVAGAPTSLPLQYTTTTQMVPKTKETTDGNGKDSGLASRTPAPQELHTPAAVLTSQTNALTAINIASVTLAASRSSLELLQTMPDANSSTA